MSFRKLTVDEEVWEWMCGQKNVVIKHPDSTEKSIVAITSLTGLTEQQFAAGKRCSAVNGGDCRNLEKQLDDSPLDSLLGCSCVCRQGMVTPQMVTDWIRKNLQ